MEGKHFECIVLDPYLPEMAAATTLRIEALTAFRRLHRTRLMIFGGDKYALEEARKKINTEFKSRQTLVDQEEITKAIGMANEAELVLRKTIVQAERVDSDRYRVKVNPDTLRSDNAKLRVGDVPENIRDDN